MTQIALDAIKACAFDAYGTLFDVHTAVGRCRERLGPKADAVSALWRQKQLEYTWLRSLMRQHADFWQVTGDALDYALDANAIDDGVLRDDLMQAYLALDAYPEVPATLAALADKGLKLSILSNGSPAMLAAAVANAGLDTRFDRVLSVEDRGIYKPDPAVYQLVCDAFDLSANEICFLSSNAWDVAGAASFGFMVVWINRFGQPVERLPGRPQAEIGSLDQLLALFPGAP
jgi:2-haloacid dehalogenase